MTSLSGIRINTSGALSLFSIDGSTARSRLAGMYLHIGCTTVDVVELSEDIDVWVDSDRMFTQALNPTLAAMVRLAGSALTHVPGPGLFLTTASNGDAAGLSARQIATIASWWETVGGANQIPHNAGL